MQSELPRSICHRHTTYFSTISAAFLPAASFYAIALSSFDFSIVSCSSLCRFNILKRMACTIDLASFGSGLREKGGNRWKAAGWKRRVGILLRKQCGQLQKRRLRLNCGWAGVLESYIVHVGHESHKAPLVWFRFVGKQLHADINMWFGGRHWRCPYIA